MSDSDDAVIYPPGSETGVVQDPGSRYGHPCPYVKRPGTVSFARGGGTNHQPVLYCRRMAAPGWQYCTRHLIKVQGVLLAELAELEEAGEDATAVKDTLDALLSGRYGVTTIASETGVLQDMSR